MVIPPPAQSTESDRAWTALSWLKSQHGLDVKFSVTLEMLCDGVTVQGFMQ